MSVVDGDFPLNVPGHRLCTSFETVHESNCVHFVPSLLVVEALSHLLLSEHPLVRPLCEHSRCLLRVRSSLFRFVARRPRLESPALVALFQEAALASGAIALSVNLSLASIWSCEDLSLEIDSEALLNEKPDVDNAPIHVHDLELHRSYLSVLQSKTNSSSSMSRYLDAIGVAHHSSVKPWKKKTLVGESAPLSKKNDTSDS